jgi:RimJ/RimL family protein N-acetyltransferase
VDGLDEGIPVRGERLVLRAFRPEEIDREWQAMVDGYPESVPVPPDESVFRDRLGRSGRLHQGWLDLAIDLGGESIGRIQTFVPPNREMPPGVFEMGIALNPESRGNGYGTEALALLTGWLFEYGGAEAVQGSTDPDNVAMRTVFERSGWTFAGPVYELDREWVRYRITRREWSDQAGAAGD